MHQQLIVKMKVIIYQNARLFLYGLYPNILLFIIEKSVTSMKINENISLKSRDELFIPITEKNN